MDQWNAGSLALRAFARWIVDGGDGARMRAFLAWLEPGDFIQTEHLFILSGLKELLTAEEEISLERLHAVLAPRDPAGIVRGLLGDIVTDRHGGPDPNGGPELDAFLLDLQDLRALRDREIAAARRRAVEVARSILARTTGVIDGARRLRGMQGGLDLHDGQTFAVFSRLHHASLSFPEGPVRAHWATDALARKDAELAQLESDAWPEVERACTTLIERMRPSSS